MMKKLLTLFRRRRAEDDLREELHSHRRMLEEEFSSGAQPPGSASRRARLRLGSEAEIVERVRDQELVVLIESCWRDFMTGARGLAGSPVFAMTAILTLAAGIGANTAVFTLLHGLLLRSLPAPDAGQLVRFGMASPAFKQVTPAIPYRTILAFRDHSESFSGISSWTLNSVVAEDRDGAPRQYFVGLVSGSGFRVLGLTAHAGRLIGDSDDVPGGPAAGWSVVLSHGFWKDRFGADPEAIGKTLKVGGVSTVIVGVAPRDFQGVWPGIIPSLYLPLQYVNVLAGRDILNGPKSGALFASIGRLKAGASLRQALNEVGSRDRQLLSEFAALEPRRVQDFKDARITVESARTGLPTFLGRTYTAPLMLMQCLVAVVLLLCCVNVSGLMMSKIEQRYREFAIRTAIGAARWRLVRQYLTESFLIASLGAALGGVIAWRGVSWLLTFMRDPNFGTGVAVEPDQTVLLVTAAFAVLTTLAAGLVPAWRAGRADPGSLLKTRGALGGARMSGRALIPVQVALSMVLVTLAALLSQSLIRLRTEPTGFDLDHVTIQTPPFHRLPQQGEARLDLYQRMVDRIERSPGVEAAAVTWYTPMTGRQASASFEGPTPASGHASPLTLAYNEVGPGYFRAMKIRLVVGREFARAERRRDVCVVNQAAEARLFPGTSGLGQVVRSADAEEFAEGVTCTVVGVAQDAKFANLREPPPPTVYFPAGTHTIRGAGNLVFLINAHDKGHAVSAYRESLQEIAPSIPLVLFATLREQMDAALGSQRAITTLCNVFGAVALFLSAIGLYGMLSTSVSRRTGEIGVRVALGARRSTVIRMILGDAMRLVAVGVAMGAAGLVVAVPYLASLFYGVSAYDPATLVAALAAMAGVAATAALIPALRAAAIDPIRALRAE